MTCVVSAEIKKVIVRNRVVTRKRGIATWCRPTIHQSFPLEVADLQIAVL